MEFVGTEASLEAPNPFKPGPHEHLRLVRDGMATTIDVQGAALYSGEVEDLEYAALDGRAPAVSLADTRPRLRRAYARRAADQSAPREC